MARAWLAAYFTWHNDEHHHSGLALFTPTEVFHGRVAEVAAIRQLALDAAHAANPLRFPNGHPRVTLPPAVVEINPIVTEAIELSASNPNTSGVIPPHVLPQLPAAPPILAITATPISAIAT